MPPGLVVVFEDASLIVIEKPEGLLSMASLAEHEKTAYAFLTNHLRRGNPRSPQRVWIVHRLDRETLGLMVFAKTEAAKLALQAHWRQAEKRYQAVVEGHPPADQGVFRSHLDESSPHRVRSVAPGERTRSATTHYRVLEADRGPALVELTLATGRRHQIRVHLSDAQCPIVGDAKYGAHTDPAHRLALHATHLQFPHPTTGETLAFESPMPQVLARLV